MVLWGTHKHYSTVVPFKAESLTNGIRAFKSTPGWLHKQATCVGSWLAGIKWQAAGWHVVSDISGWLEMGGELYYLQICKLHRHRTSDKFLLMVVSFQFLRMVWECDQSTAHIWGSTDSNRVFVVTCLLLFALFFFPLKPWKCPLGRCTLLCTVTCGHTKDFMCPCSYDCWNVVGYVKIECVINNDAKDSPQWFKPCTWVLSHA